MYKNFRPLVDEKYRDDELYKNPPKEVWDAYRGDKEVRQKRKKDMKANAKKNSKKAK